MPRLILTRPGRRRPGTIMTMFAILLPILLGLIALVIDGGLLLSSSRTTQNAADAGALTAAQAIFRGNSSASAATAARAMVRSQPGLSGLTDAQITVSIPPATGPWTNQKGFVETTVNAPTKGFFLKALGLGASNTLRGRAVAGYEPAGVAEGVIVLDPACTSQDGNLNVQGGAILKVDGAVVVNPMGKGIDQYNRTVTTPYNQYSVSTGNNGRIYCVILNVAGGVDVLENIYNIADWPNTPPMANRLGTYPLYAGMQSPLIPLPSQTLTPDPLKSLTRLPVPQTATLGKAYDNVANRYVNLSGTPPGISINSGNYTLSPGVWSDINITGGAVTFSEGVYVISPSRGSDGFRIANNPTVTSAGKGAMFYLTGNDYLSIPGQPGFYDVRDGTTETNDSMVGGPSAWPANEDHGIKFPTLDLQLQNGANVSLAGYPYPAGAANPVNMLFYYRRRFPGNDSNVRAKITSQPGQNVGLTGVIYTKWGQMDLVGGGTYDAQFLVGSLKLSGNATFNIRAAGKQQLGAALLVSLVD